MGAAAPILFSASQLIRF